MRSFRYILSALAGFMGLLLLAGGVALTNAVGDFTVGADEEFLRFLAIFVDVANVVTAADQGAAILFLSGLVFLGLAWAVWPSARR